MRTSGIAVAALSVLASTGLLLAPPAAAGGAGEQGRLPHRWWKSDEVRAVLQLTEEQSTELGEIYQRTLPKQRESMRRLNAEERALSRLIGDMDVEEIDVTRQVDRVEAARSELSKTRTLMVFRMYRVLTERQRTLLKEWMEADPDADPDLESRRRPC